MDFVIVIMMLWQREWENLAATTREASGSGSGDNGEASGEAWRGWRRGLYDDDRRNSQSSLSDHHRFDHHHEDTFSTSCAHTGI
jgi:hypothetical protein